MGSDVGIFVTGYNGSIVRSSGKDGVLIVGMSAVKSKERRGQSTLPWGTPELIGKYGEVSVWNFIWE